MINLYSIGNTNFDWNGDATLTPISCVLNCEINGSWSLKVECPYDDEKKYELIEVGAILGVDVDCIDEQEYERQLFRIYDYNKGIKSIEVVAYPVAMESTFDTPVDNLNITDKTASQAVSALQAFTNKYTLWTNVSSGQHSAQYENTSINSAIANGKDNSFIEVWGGEIVYDNYKYKIFNRIGDSATEQTVTYGRNITDIKYKTDESGLITRIFPVSNDGIRLNGNGYVDSPHINDYPYIHARFLQTSNTLVDAKTTSNSRTAQLTQSISSQIQTLANTLSHSIYNSAIANRAWEREYIKSVRSAIVSAVQDYCTQNIYHTDMVNVMDKAINSGMAWMKDIQSVEYNWHGDYTNGWWYGVDNNEYCKNEYAFIDRKWCWFNSDGYWVEKWDDDDDNWNWVQPKGATGKKYGNNKKYYAHDDWIYKTADGVLKCYWMNEEGWYEESYTGKSSWVWQPWGSGWWFGEEGASSSDLKKFAHDQWLFIDGTYYFFDHEGWYDGKNKIENYAWDWVESNQRYWFGNEDTEYQATYLVNQWAKIDNEWHKFDANGFDINADTLSQQIATVFKNGMGELKTLCESLNTQAYTLLYTLLREFCANKYSNNVDLPEVQIKLNLVDLSKTKEYADFEGFEKIHLGDAVHCVDYEHNITTTQRVVGLTYDCIRKYNTSVTVGIADSSVADKIGANAGGQPVAGGFDTSAMEQRISANTTEVGRLQQTKQDKLTAGQNITINGSVISASGGVTPNPSGTPTAVLNTIKIDNVIYSVGGDATATTNANITILSSYTSVGEEGSVEE